MFVPRAGEYREVSFDAINFIKRRIFNGVVLCQ
jgi:hypothetical protein